MERGGEVLVGMGVGDRRPEAYSSVSLVGHGSPPRGVLSAPLSSKSFQGSLKFQPSPPFLQEETKDPPSGREMTPSLSGQGFSCSVAWRPPGTDSSQLLRAAEPVGSEAWAAGQEGSGVAASGLDAVLSFLTETRGRHLLVGPGQELMTGGLAPGLG